MGDRTVKLHSHRRDGLLGILITHSMSPAASLLWLRVLEWFIASLWLMAQTCADVHFNFYFLIADMIEHPRLLKKLLI